VRDYLLAVVQQREKAVDSGPGDHYLEPLDFVRKQVRISQRLDARDIARSILDKVWASHVQAESSSADGQLLGKTAADKEKFMAANRERALKLAEKEVEDRIQAAAKKLEKKRAADEKQVWRTLWVSSVHRVIPFCAFAQLKYSMQRKSDSLLRLQFSEVMGSEASDRWRLHSQPQRGQAPGAHAKELIRRLYEQWMVHIYALLEFSFAISAGSAGTKANADIEALVARGDLLIPDGPIKDMLSSTASSRAATPLGLLGNIKSSTGSVPSAARTVGVGVGTGGGAGTLLESVDAAVANHVSFSRLLRQCAAVFAANFGKKDASLEPEDISVTVDANGDVIQRGDSIDCSSRIANQDDQCAGAVGAAVDATVVVPLYDPSRTALLVQNLLRHPLAGVLGIQAGDTDGRVHNMRVIAALLQSKYKRLLETNAVRDTFQWR
jgi:hypothetical protein